MIKQGLISFALLFSFSYHFTTTLAAHAALSPAQSPSKTQAQTPAKAPTATQPSVEPPSQVPLVQAPPHRTLAAPTDVTKILEKADGFSVFIRLLKSTQVNIQIESQLNVSNTLTIFAPTNGAFSSLKPGTLNSLTNEQKVQLVQYHILPTFISLSNFETLSNPVRTQASNTNDYPLNITTEGKWVNISTGLVNTTISGTIYEDNKLAVYRVDKVLLPLGIFAPRPKPLAPAPTPVLKPKNESSSSSSLESSDSPVEATTNASNGFSLARNGMATIGVAMVATVFLWGDHLRFYSGEN
ncbi:hypothetical protein UlMin_013685 [Ulmus minor]